MLRHRGRIGPCLLMATWAVMLAACGSGSNSAAPSGPAATAGGATSSGGCPISADALSTATSLRWEQKERLENRPLETNESIKATVCIFTAAAELQAGGDPLVFRTDVVTGRDAATVRGDFAQTCRDAKGTTRPSGGGTVCDVNGVIVEGIKGEGDRVVDAYIVNADTSTAARLTPAFAKIVGAIR